MGVPGFFRHVIDNYPKSHFWDPNMKVDYLFFDFNGFIYTIAAELQDDTWEFPRDDRIFEDALINRIMDVTKGIVEMIDPHKLVYIAIDGPPPFAKMKQQRDRRSYGAWMKNFMKDEYNVVSSGWDKTNITPGTIFMTKLDKEFKKRINGRKWLHDYNIVYDGPKRPMEAEHKYMNLIDTATKNENIVIASPDADQIILSMKYLDKSIYILKNIKGEKLQEKYSKDQDWIYLDISYFNEALVSKNRAVDSTTFINDYIFMTFLEGNDFVPAIYYLPFKKDQLRTLLAIYNKNELSGLFYWEDGHYYVDATKLYTLMYHISTEEWHKIQGKRYEVINFIDKYNQGVESIVKRCTFEEPMQVEHLNIYCPNHPLFNQFYKEWNNVYKNYKSDYWKRAFYQHFIGHRYDLDDVCLEYSKALQFNLRYYFNDTIYWHYQYPYACAPLPTDYALYLRRHPNVFKEINLPVGFPVNPFVQLAYILPRSLQHIVPKEYSQMYLNNRDYPSKGQLDLLTGDKFIYIDMNLPPIYLKTLIEDYNKVKNSFTDNEKERDKMEHKPLIVWCDE